MDFYFKFIFSGFFDNILWVLLDILFFGSIKIGFVEIDGKFYSDFDVDKFFVKLFDIKEWVKVKVNIVFN